MQGYGPSTEELVEGSQSFGAKNTPSPLLAPIGMLKVFVNRYEKHPIKTLKLGPLPKIETTRLAIILPVPLKTDLERYAELHGELWGDTLNVAVLIPHILATFLAKDREFQRLRKAGSPSREVEQK